MIQTTELPVISKSKIKRISTDPVKTAKAVNLLYVSDTQPGIVRIRKGKSFIYLCGKKAIRKKEDLDRIKSLVIPPAWENVWICVASNGHLQATGIDALKRKQYKYHPLWIMLRNHTKYSKLQAFGKALPAMRLVMEKHLSLPQLTHDKVLAAVISLMERTNIRVGNSVYEKLYGSFGLTTLKDKHVNVSKSNIHFSFKGKKGIYHDIEIKSKKLANIVQQCRDIPGKELFQYYDEEGNRKAIDSGMVNQYIKDISGEDFTAKDFRTWAGSVNALMAFKELGGFEKETEARKKIVEALDRVAEQLGNTRNVCKKYYVHPTIIQLYENKQLDKYMEQLDEIEKDDDKTGLAKEEKLLMKIIE